MRKNPPCGNCNGRDFDHHGICKNCRAGGPILSRLIPIAIILAQGR